MGNLTINIYSKEKINGQRKTLIQNANIQFDDPLINITPAVLANNFDLDKEKIYGFNANINCQNQIIEISGFEYFSLKSFMNINSSIAHFKISNIDDSCSLNNFTIEKLDVNNADLLLVESEVFDLNIGNSIVHGKSIDEINFDNIKKVKTDLRGSKIERARIFVPNRKIEVKRTNINYLAIQERAAFNIDLIKIWINSDIKRLYLSGNIEKFQIKNSNINNLVFHENCKVEKMIINLSTIQKTHNCNMYNINNKNMNTLQLIMNSAKNSNDYSLYTKAGYEFMKKKNKNQTNIFSKFISFFMKITCGYGFKPFRTLLLTVSTWILFGFIYWSFDLFGLGGLNFGTNKYEEFKKLILSLYFSIVTFTTTGFGDITPRGYSRIFSGLEAVLGILFTALFIFALTKKFGNFD